jgi:hypothetical protein
MQTPTPTIKANPALDISGAKLTPEQRGLGYRLLMRKSRIEGHFQGWLVFGKDDLACAYLKMPAAGELQEDIQKHQEKLGKTA